MSNYTAQEKLDYLWEGLEGCHNGEFDMASLRDSEYGEEMDKWSMLRYQFEEDPMGPACLEYYKNKGVKKDAYHFEDMYKRYIVLTPEHIPANAKLPVVFWNHGGGNPIETDEFSTYITDLVPEKKIILVMAQNTSWDSLEHVLDEVLENYPANPERVYAIGYSQGGQVIHSAILRAPRRFAAVAMGGIEPFAINDNLNLRYTIEEAERLMHTLVPVMQLVGSNEFLNFLPMNYWRPVRFMPGGHPLNLYTREDFNHANDPSNPKQGRPDKPLPQAGVDRNIWKLDRMNLRLRTLGVKPLDIEKCLSFRDLPDSDYHKWIGFYGEEEEVRNYHGRDHVIYKYYNAEGLNTYRFCSIENMLHWPFLDIGTLGWEFVSQFRRDTESGRIVGDQYKAL